MFSFVSEKESTANFDDNRSSLLKSPDGHNQSQSRPKFQPGDHVIRWQVLKAMLWPIQIHGIVLSVEEKSKISENAKDDTQEMPKTYKDEFINQNESNKIDFDPYYVYTIADFGYTSSQQSMDQGGVVGGENKNIVLKQIGNINEKMKSFYNNAKNNTLPSSKETIPNNDAYMDISQIPSYDSSITRDVATEKDDTSSASSSLALENDMKSMDIKDLNAAFDVQLDNTREGRRFQIVTISSPVDVKKWHKIDYGKSLLKNNKLKEKISESSKKLWKKLSFRGRISENYSTLASDQDEVRVSATPQSLNDNTPKLPESDPAEIVLARTNYVIDQQDLPQKLQTLPPYHILYSNSECLAVWCKTGKFSTLQAAVFLHSTAVGNAKSTFLMTSAAMATQPWLIPVVGLYGVVGIGMPYLLLKKCKEKWRISEQLMTDGFWSTASHEVYVSAVSNWSGIGGDEARDIVTNNDM